MSEKWREGGAYLYISSGLWFTSIGAGRDIVVVGLYYVMWVMNNLVHAQKEMIN
jgi:hypothetical protein